MDMPEITVVGQTSPLQKPTLRVKQRRPSRLLYTWSPIGPQFIGKG